MAAFLQATQNSSVGSQTSLVATFGKKTLDGSTLVVVTRQDVLLQTPSVTDDQGNVYTIAKVTTGAAYGCKLWYCLKAKAGVQQVTASFSGGDVGLQVFAAEYFGPSAVDQSAEGGLVACPSGVDAVVTPSWTAAQTNNLIVAFINHATGAGSYGTTAAGTGFFKRLEADCGGAFSNLILCDNAGTPSSAGAGQKATWTQTVAFPAAFRFAIAFKDGTKHPNTPGQPTTSDQLGTWSVTQGIVGASLNDQPTYDQWTFLDGTVRKDWQSAS